MNKDKVNFEAFNLRQGYHSTPDKRVFLQQVEDMLNAGKLTLAGVKQFMSNVITFGEVVGTAKTGYKIQALPARSAPTVPEHEPDPCMLPGSYPISKGAPAPTSKPYNCRSISRCG